MAKEIEKYGIPVAVMTAIPMIPLSVGASRVVRGVRVEHVCGDPRLSRELDREIARQIVATALRAVEAEVDGPTLFEPSKSPPMESAGAS
ncbi:MAG: hypothetical protein HY678_08705 [Chloroflexi bacterium]|nr:hypothetical protein [Chloroflexota bacterium]